MSTVLNKPNCYIFDLDGTLCDVEHRRKFVTTNPKNWNAWDAGLVNDPVNIAVAVVYRTLCESQRANMIIVSGRSEDYKEQTGKWLFENRLYYDEIYMRKSGDNRDDAIVKSEIADEIEKKFNIIAVFDDRLKVVKMWQERGIFVFDVGQGRGDF
jgi:hypothetical protein